MSGQDWDGLARSIDQLNSAISQDVRVGDAKVVILNRDAARQVRDAAETWQRSYGNALEAVVEWLKDGPPDWPWTSQDIADMIVAGCPPWNAPGVERKPITAMDVVEWLEQRPTFDAKDAPRQIAADIRLQFGMDARNHVPLAGDGRTTLELWASRGLFPGDMINEDGDLLGADGNLCERGTAIIRKDQAARAAVFGWMLHQGYLPSSESPDHVVVTR